jgi:hypothetical protein
MRLPKSAEFAGGHYLVFDRTAVETVDVPKI